MNAFVGREKELATLRDALDQAIRGGGSLLLVSGEAGIGKTSLVQRLVARATDEGALVLSGHCYDLSTTPPYGLWLELAERYRSDDNLPELPDVLKRGTGAAGLTSQAAIFEVTREFFEAISAVRPLVLILEDLHWADQASLDLLRYFARYIDGDRILVVATYRDDEITRQHPLFALMPTLIRECQAVRIELGTLARSHLQALVRDRWSLPAQDEKRLVDQLLNFADGHPLFTVEVLRTLEQNDFLNQTESGWQLAGLSQIPVPSLVLQVIEARLTRLEDEDRHFLEVAAVIGHQVPLDVWQRVAGLSDDDLLNILDKAIALHLLEDSLDGTTVNFVHALTREALYRSILPPRRRIWHRLIAEALADSPAPIPDSVGYHFHQADDVRAVEWLIRAGEWAERTFAWRSAVDRYLTVERLLAGDDTRLRERGWLRYRAARLRLFIDPTSGLADLDEALRIAQEAGDAVLRASVLVRRGHLRCFSGDSRRGCDEMATGVAAWDALTLDEKLSCEYSEVAGADPYLNIFRGTHLLWMAGLGRYRECLEQGEPFLEEMESSRDRLLAARHIYWLDGYVGVAEAHAMIGNPNRALDVLNVARERFAYIRIPAMESYSALTTLRHVLIPYQTERVEERNRIADEMDDAWNRAAGAIRPEMTSRLQWVQLLALQGEWDEVVYLASHGRDWHANAARQVELLASLGPVARSQGNAALAWNQIETALPDGPATEPGETRFVETTELISLAVQLSLDAGNLRDARTWLDARDRWLEWSGPTRLDAGTGLLWARYYLANGERQRARSSVEESMGRARDPRQPPVILAGRRFLGELDTLERRFDSAKYHLQESLDIAEACDLPFEIALCKLAIAELRAATDQRAEALRMIEHVVEICTSLGARPTLERADRLRKALSPRREFSPFGLTSREIEVLELLVQGMPDREIGEALFISRHTVMRHVSSILRKLDVDSRTAAAARWLREEAIETDERE